MLSFLHPDIAQTHYKYWRQRGTYYDFAEIRTVELPRYPNKNSHNDTYEKDSGEQYSLSGAPLHSTTKNH